MRAALGCLLLGLVITIALAWGMAAWSAYGWGRAESWGARQRAPDEGGGELRAHLFRGLGSAIVETTARDLQRLAPGALAPETIIPRWARVAVLPWGASRPWPASGEQERRAARGTGWPVIALWHEYRWSPPGTRSFGEYVTPGGVRLEPSMGMPGAWPVDYPRALPLRPAWAGLAADTVLWALASWATWRAARLAIRVSRRRRGRCGDCGYDRAGLPAGAPCPECGREA